MKEKPRTGKGSDKGGRPEYKPTVDARQTVEEMKYCGESENVIARALGIDPATLRKHFKDELADGFAHRRKEVISLMFKTAREGNAANQKKLEEIGRAVGAAEAVGRRGQVPKPQKLGKKQEQQAAAQGVTGKFAPPAPPKLVVSNG